MPPDRGSGTAGHANFLAFPRRSFGEMFAARKQAMAVRRTLDGRPGALPEIRLEGDSVMFHLEIVNGRTTSRLLIRCDPDGSVWVSIGPAEIEDRSSGA